MHSVSVTGDLSAERRILAIVVPELMVELAKEPNLSPSRKKRMPIGVVLVDERASEDEPVKATALLDAVNDEARRFGVREGQSIAEACALIAKLSVREVERDTVRTALGRLAEVGLGFGQTVALEAPDTVWVDVTGAAHLFGGEVALGAELSSRIRAMGHVARVAIASGPRLAQAFARWGAPAAGADEKLGERGLRVVPADRTREAVSSLPITALPIDRDHATWLARLGVLTFGELAKIPRAAAAARLGDRASAVLDLAEGKDDEPLVAYQVPSSIVEETQWEEPVDGTEPLLFVLRGLCARLSARLAGRGEAAQKIVLVIQCDRSIAQHRGVPLSKELVFDLASPLWREEELRRVVGSRLERTRLEAPSLGLRLEAPAVIRALGRQLDLSRVSGGITGNIGLESLPVLLAELGADIGKERVGVLSLVDTHRPEKKSALVPALEDPRALSRLKKTKKTRVRDDIPLRKVKSLRAPGAPTRFLTKPLPLEVALRVGATLRIDHRLFTIDSVHFVERLDAIEWWTGAPVARDYLRLWLSGVEGGLEALVYVDRASGKRFLHAIGD